ncbi:MAG: putative acetyltransferase [Chloroflexi bacterium ADurb.Bin180]|nr:MAG: putative acetyltransferase [Chloroflexi bacterium ADurb.Bin180]
MLPYRSTSQLLAGIPGMLGVLVRRIWYRAALQACGSRLFVDWGAVLRSPRSVIGDDVYVGIRSWIGEVSIGSKVMLSGPCIVTSGSHTHGISRDRPMSEQPVTLATVHIGDDVWVGAGAIIMADLATGTVVGAGSVVTKATEPYSIVVGNPARKIRDRE